MHIGMRESEAGALVVKAMMAAGLRNAFALSLFAGVFLPSIFARTAHSDEL